MNKIEKCFLLLFATISYSAFSFSKDFYNKFSSYNVYFTSTDTKHNFEFASMYSSAEKKLKIVCVNSQQPDDITILLESNYPISWLSSNLIYSEKSETLYFYISAPEDKNGVYKYQGLYSCKVDNGRFLPENIIRYYIPLDWMFGKAINTYINCSPADYNGFLDYIYSFTDSCEKIFCIKTADNNLLTEVDALKYCKDNNLFYNDAYQFLNTYLKRVENGEITKKSAYTINGNSFLADSFAKDDMHDSFFIKTSEGIWMVNSYQKEVQSVDINGNTTSAWIPSYLKIFLLEDSTGKIAKETPEVLRNLQLSPEIELLTKGGMVNNDCLILKDRNKITYYTYKNNSIESFTSYEEALLFSSKEQFVSSTQLNSNIQTKKPYKINPYVSFGAILLLAILELIYIIYIKSKKYETHLNKKDKKLYFKIQDQERSKVSKDIHDSVVQNIRAIRLEAEMLEVTEKSNQRKNKIIEEMTNVISLLRNICYNLSPAELSLAENTDNSNVELISVIDTLSKQFTAKTKIPCSISLEKDIVLPELDVEVSRNIVRVVQECFTNIEKHSFATRVQILVKNEVKNNSRKLIIFIIDDGIGCEVHNLTSKKTHFGIRNMIERMNMVGGNIEFFSEPNEGLNIQLQIPYGE